MQASSGTESYHFELFKPGRGEWQGQIVKWHGGRCTVIWVSPVYDEVGIAEAACRNRARVLGLTVNKATDKE